MNLHAQQLAFSEDPRRKATLGVVFIGAVLRTPFSINNFIRARFAMAASSLAIIRLLALSAWNIWRGRPDGWLTLLGLALAILFL